MQHFNTPSPVLPSFADASAQLRPGDTLPVFYVSADADACMALCCDEVSRDFLLHSMFVHGAHTANVHARRAGWGLKVRHPDLGWLFVPTRLGG